MPGTNRFAARLEDERARRGMNLTEFARDVLKVPLPNVSKYINTDRHPSRPQMRKIAAALGTTVAELDALLPEPPEQDRVSPDVADPHILREIATVRRMLEEMQRTGAPSAEPFPDVPVAPLEPDLEARIRAAIERERRRSAAVGADAVGEEGDPVRVREPGLVWRGVPLPVGTLAWLDPDSEPETGDVVRVGDDDPVTLRSYDPADPPDGPVTGVAWLFQIRARRPRKAAAGP